MVHYKLSYFPIRGAGEICRQVLTVAKQDFEDARIPTDEWPQHKEKMPFGQLPVLEEDGKELAQSYAISRYLARKFHLAGANPWEEAQVDALADQWKDCKNEFRPYFIVFIGRGQGDLEKLKVDVFVPTVKKHLPFFVNALKKSGSGYLVGQGLTWVDLLVAEGVSFLLSVAPELLNEFPEINAHQEKVRSNPELKKWIETRPTTAF